LPVVVRLTREALEAAAGRPVPDLVAPGLRVLFCGINPGLWSGAVGHHFAHPGNRFWRVLAEAGFTERALSPDEEARLLEVGVGVTNLVNRATRSAAELSAEELRAGAARIEAICRRYRPAMLAVLGVGAYRIAFDGRSARPGPQPRRVGGVPVWLLPNPSGLQAHYQLPELVSAFRALRNAVEAAAGPPRG
jgi:TDG/mug DNA glycosylase family protein